MTDGAARTAGNEAIAFANSAFHSATLTRRRTINSATIAESAIDNATLTRRRTINSTICAQKTIDRATIATRAINRAICA